MDSNTTSGFLSLFRLKIGEADKLVKAGKPIPPELGDEILKAVIVNNEELKKSKENASLRFKQSIGVGSVIGIAGIIIGMIV